MSGGGNAPGGLAAHVKVRRRRWRADATRCPCCGAPRLREPGTAEQALLLRLVAGMAADAGGVTPGFRALAARYGTPSLGTINRLVGHLEAAGWLARDGARRKVRLLHQPKGSWRNPLLAARLGREGGDALAVIAELTPAAMGKPLPTIGDLVGELDLDGRFDTDIAAATALATALAETLALAGWIGVKPPPGGNPDPAAVALVLLRRPARHTLPEDDFIAPVDQRGRVNAPGAGNVVALVPRRGGRRHADGEETP